MPAPPHVPGRSARRPWTTVRYGELPEQVADVWLPQPDQSSPTLVVMIHGGFWRSRYDRRHVRPMCGALSSNGYAVAAIEYRRTGQAGGGWPGTLDDVAAALASVPALVGRLLGTPGPTTPALPLVLMGHSAGGHLAVWAATPSESRPAIAGLAGVVSLAGVLDLARADELRLGAAGDEGAVATLLGGHLDQVPDRFASSDPARLAPPLVPVVLVHGTLDRTVPLEISERYAEHVRAEGGDVTLIPLEGVDHADVIEPRNEAWGAVLGALGRLQPD